MALWVDKLDIDTYYYIIRLLTREAERLILIK
jgi:hypothetical protein